MVFSAPAARYARLLETGDARRFECATPTDDDERGIGSVELPYAVSASRNAFVTRSTLSIVPSLQSRLTASLSRRFSLGPKRGALKIRGIGQPR